MDDVSIKLVNCLLFKSFNSDSIACELAKIKYNIKEFNKGDVIAIEETNCTKIGIVLSGNIEVQKIYGSGKTVTIEKLNESSIFGEVIIFSTHNTYPATIVSSSKTQIMFILKEDILKICSSNNIFLNNFMSLLSNKILMLNRKLKAMSYKTIRQKIANYILEESKRQKSTEIELFCSRKEMAEQLGIPRPSLSREIINMKEESILDFDRDTIYILDSKYLEDILVE